MYSDMNVFIQTEQVYLSHIRSQGHKSQNLDSFYCLPLHSYMALYPIIERQRDQTTQTENNFFA